VKLLLAFVLIVFVVWDIGWMLAGVRPLFPWQLKSMLQQHPEKLVLLDVRTAAEFRLLHIPGARHTPDILAGGELPEDLRPRLQAAPDSMVVLICMTGHRSPVAAKMLQSRLDVPVVNLTWGMLGWLAVLGPVERGGGG
jgi:rhodanese-related sulfurtransferase